MTQAARDVNTGRFVKVDRPLTAAVMSYDEGQIERNPPAPAAAWQSKAWRLWRTLGVLHYPTSFMADQVSRLDWDVFVGGDQLEEKDATAAVEAVCDPMPVPEATRRLALNLEVAGDVYHVRRNNEWDVLSSSGSKWRERLREADIVVRGWMADPVDPEKADSAVRSALDVAEEIRVMQALSRSQSRNRLAQRGLLLRPSEGQFQDGEDFAKKLHDAMTTPIGDEYAASAVVPPEIAFPGDLIEKWRHIVLESPYDDKLDTRLEGAIRRLALSLNMPPELLLGLADVNHWTAWQTEESTYRAHVEPLALPVAQVLAEAMERSSNRADIVVKPNPKKLLARRQSVADAFEALRLGVVGFEYVRDAIGADDDDAPKPDELELILAIQGRTAPGSVPAVGTGTTQPGPPAAPEPSGNGAAPTQNGQPIAADVDADTNRELDRLGEQLADIDQHLLTALQGAAEMTTQTVRDRVGAEEVGVQDAIASSVERLGRVWVRELTSARKVLRSLGITAQGEEWTQAQEQSVTVLTEGMTEWLADTIERTDSDMPAIPTDLLRRALAAAGGSETAFVAALTRPRGLLPLPDTTDPMGFAVGVLSTKDLADQGLRFVQWRFRYGDAARAHPFIDHKDQDGRFADLDGTVAGWYPGDHKGCLCGLSPVYRRGVSPDEVEDELE